MHKKNTLFSISNSQLAFFLLWPFGSLLSSLKNFRRPSSKTLFWLFCSFFGMMFIYADPFAAGGADSARYAAKLISINANPFSWGSLLSSFYSVQTGVVDIYEPLVTWIVAQFTGNPRVLFFVFAIVFGYFYTQNLWMIFDRITKKVNLLLLLFMLSFALINPIWQINGVRMNTAAQVFFYGNLLYLLRQQKKGLFWSAAAVFFHFSFFLPVLVLLSWHFFPKKITLFFMFYITTSFLIELDLQIIRNLLNQLPDVFRFRTLGYVSEAYIEGKAYATTQYASHVIFAGKAFRWVTNLWVVIFFLKYKHWHLKFPKIESIFSFALLLGGFANLASQIASGGRFLALSNSLFYAFFVFMLGQNGFEIGFKFLKLLSIPFILFYIVFRIRVGFDYIGFFTIMGNPIIALFVDDQTPLIVFVKNLLR
jgi:hypothetical protein